MLKAMMREVLVFGLCLVITVHASPAMRYGESSSGTGSDHGGGTPFNLSELVRKMLAYGYGSSSTPMNQYQGSNQVYNSHPSSSTGYQSTSSGSASTKRSKLIIIPVMGTKTRAPSFIMMMLDKSPAQMSNDNAQSSAPVMSYGSVPSHMMSYDSVPSNMMSYDDSPSHMAYSSAPSQMSSYGFAASPSQGMSYVSMPFHKMSYDSIQPDTVSYSSVPSQIMSYNSVQYPYLSADCNDGDLRAVIGNDDVYEVCVHGNWVELPCAPGTWFDASVLMCRRVRIAPIDEYESPVAWSPIEEYDSPSGPQVTAEIGGPIMARLMAVSSKLRNGLDEHLRLKTPTGKTILLTLSPKRATISAMNY